MTKKTQDLSWACLPKEARDKIREHYQSCYCNIFSRLIFEFTFGFHNLTLNTEREEMLMVSRSKVQDRFNTFNNPNWASNDKEAYGAQLVIDTLDLLFGDKCLPDKEGVDCGKLNQMLDEALEKETPESLNEWMDSREHPSVQVEPMFTKDEVVRSKSTNEILSVCQDGSVMSFPINDLEPYTEPEKGNKEEKSGNNSKFPNQTKDNMEEKELNRKALYDALCELETASIKVRKALISM